MASGAQGTNNGPNHGNFNDILERVPFNTQKTAQVVNVKPLNPLQPGATMPRRAVPPPPQHNESDFLHPNSAKFTIRKSATAGKRDCITNNLRNLVPPHVL